ncbi:MAG: hypothetical protein ABI472_21035, partial [Ginsengibacter sp.]
LPAFWGNKEIYEKVNYVKNHPDINTVFIGSSKVKHQIIPQVFDSVNGGRTTSFNLGCDALFMPESFQVLNYIIDSSAIRNIIYEIRPVYHIYPENLHITRTIYYHTWNNYIATLSNCMHSNLPLYRKLNLYATFSIAQAESLLNFNFAQGYIDFKNYDVKYANRTYATDRGFSAMGDGPSEGLKNSNRELNERAKLSRKYAKLYEADSLNGLKINEIYLQEIKKIFNKAAQHQIKLVLLFPPALREFEYKEILPLFKQLKNTQFINLSAIDKYPEFYTVENNYETDHLNAVGSNLYSVTLADAFNKLLK